MHCIIYQNDRLKLYKFKFLFPFYSINAFLNLIILYKHYKIYFIRINKTAASIYFHNQFFLKKHVDSFTSIQKLCDQKKTKLKFIIFLKQQFIKLLKIYFYNLAPSYQDKKDMRSQEALSERQMNKEQIQTSEIMHQKLPFSILTQVYEKVGNTRGENSKNIQKGLLSNMFKTLIRQSPQDLVRGYWLSIMKIAPDYEKNQLGIGKEILLKSISKSCGMSEKQVRDQNMKIGDLGEVAQNSKSSQKTMDSFFTKKKAKQPLTIQKVFNSFRRIASTKGNNSNSEKQSVLMSLILQSSKEETKFIVRWVEGNLKIAAGQKTMQKALIAALFQQLLPRKMQTQQNQLLYERIIKKSMAQYPNDAQIIRNLIRLKGDFQQLSNICKLTLGIPCRPMLAKPTRGIGDILNRFDGKKMTCQYKYDGLRGQIHYNQGKIEIFSRNLQNITEAYVDIIHEINKNLEAIKIAELKSFILDCQIVAIHKKTKQLLPFQVLSTRARKATNLDDIQVHVNLFAFDILYYNEPLTHLPLCQRREYIQKLADLFTNIIRISEHRQLEEFESIDEFLQDAIKFGTEGLMIKDLDSAYTCSRRSWEWVKLKKDYINGLGDTLDIVPIAAFYGSGKRTGLYGSYLLATYNADMQVFETICKIGTGFSDEVLKAAYEFFQDKTTPVKPKQYRISDQMQKVDVWFNPAVVWEIKGADFQLSPVYTCGIGDVDINKGIGLRFPRLIKVREDKKPFEASTNQFVMDLYKQQAVVQNRGNQDDEDDYY